MKSNWFVVRLAPGATRKASNRKFIIGPRGGRSSNLETIDASVVELACAQAGIRMHIPKVRIAYLDHKTKSPTHTVRPMIPGFAFVEGPVDFSVLEGVRGVSQVLRNATVPVQMSEADMAAMRDAERVGIIDFHDQWSQMNLMRSKMTKKQMRKEFPKGRRVELHDGRVPGWCTIKDVTSRGTVKLIHDKLNAVIEIDVDELELAA